MGCKKEEYPVERRCCDLCPRGQYRHADCERSDPQTTECRRCGPGLYTEVPNFNNKCLDCRKCHSTNHLRTSGRCEPGRNARCECMAGFYCTDRQQSDTCETCVAVTKCPLGSGVKTKATPLNNTVCTPCLSGTYSHVEDAVSPCLDHTRCEEEGVRQIAAGTETSNAVCHLVPECHWMLPAGLWAGLVLTSIFIILIYIICWRAKRRSYRTAVCSHPSGSLEAPGPVLFAGPPQPSSEWAGHCQEICDGEKGPEPLFLQQGTSLEARPCLQHCDIETDGPPREPITALDRLGQSMNHMNGHCTSPSLVIQSEPQEDEWRGS